jgi:protein-tyrosine phosphatase
MSSMGTKVAARCQAGCNRSSLIVALVLLKEGYSAAEAVNLIRDRRSANALCNPHFVRFIEAQAKASQLERASG